MLVYRPMFTLHLSMPTGDKTLFTSPSGVAEFYSICPEDCKPCEFNSLEAAEYFAARHFPNSLIYISSPLYSYELRSYRGLVRP